VPRKHDRTTDTFQRAVQRINIVLQGGQGQLRRNGSNAGRPQQADYLVPAGAICPCRMNQYNSDVRRHVQSFLIGPPVNSRTDGGA
jgi:hypothetical protein